MGQFKQLHLPASCSSKAPTHPLAPFSNGAVITPLYNLTHRLSQPQNRGYRLGGGSRGKSGTESLFSKSRCWTLRAPFCVWPFLHSPHCLPLLHVERHSAGRNRKFYFSTKNFKSLKKSTFERKLSTAQFFPSMSLGKMNHGLKWNEIMLIICTVSAKLNLRKITPNFGTVSVSSNFFFFTVFNQHCPGAVLQITWHKCSKRFCSCVTLWKLWKRHLKALKSGILQIIIVLP